MYQLYHDYFKWLCQLHPSLLHTDQKKVFEVVSVEEALGDFRKVISTSDYLFRLIDYTWGVEQTGNFQGQRKVGGFVVAKKVDARGGVAAGRIAARSAAETIVVDFVMHMVADSRAGHPLFKGSIDELDNLKLNVQPLLDTGDGGWDGLMGTFEWLEPREFELSCHSSTTWKQLSPTSY